MKVAGLLLATSITAFAGVSQAVTLAAQSLKCGGVASIEMERGIAVLEIYTVGSNSTCESVAIKSLRVNSRIDNRDGFRIAMNPKDLGNQVALVINGSDVVILDINRTADIRTGNSGSGSSSNSGMSEYERRRIEIEQQRDAREKAKQTAEDVGVLADGAAAVGTIAVDSVIGTER